MKKILFLLLVFYTSFQLSAQDIIAYTKDGKKILLKDDGTWELIETDYISYWQVETLIDPLDGSKSFHFMIEAFVVQNGYGNVISLVVRYTKNKTTLYEKWELYVYWNKYLGKKPITVSYRIEQEKEIKISWYLSSDHKATFFPSNVKDLLRSLFNKEKLVVKVTPTDYNPITATFNISSLKQEIEKQNIFLQ